MKVTSKFKKQVHGLDDIGFIGTQLRTEKQIKLDAARTARYILAEKKKALKKTSSRSTKSLSPGV